ncbi:type VI secretion system protein ImpG [Paraburkholderia bannensis]|uniref:Type VI secretion system protein ImpG n=1 Tax=Paraburkholderia bannensis TaxID=765414 RepID=A0A7W9WSQ1_9BURK|nr:MULTISPECIES: type VI secretion system baseplate subunit TssF [Paraburkholderia]MBB3257463.1 type VI secretion system protein ImpG [Paraburkholderia sp. WP4_3_2]MBB6102476.1 type VI secretion system protein ImpG [Paraburkholderia bannensis]
MADLKGSFERELLLLRRGLADFGARNSRVAGRLSMMGEHSEDMHVERMIQSAALLNGRIRERLEDDVPDFTAPLLEVLYPEFLRAFPSCSVACFEPSAGVERLAKPSVIKRGTHLTTRVGEYGFRTVYDVSMSPLAIDDTIYRLPSAVPASVQLPEGAAGVFSISFVVRSESVSLADAAGEIARVYIDAPETPTASIIDAILYRGKRAFIEIDSSGRWSALESVPVTPVGFADDEALFTRPDGEESQYRLLLEYFGWPVKFHFLDFHLGKLLRGRAIKRRITLHIPVCGLHPETAAAISLYGLNASNFKLRCAPVVNLFPCPAEPIALKDVNLPAYPMIPQAVSPEGAQVWAVGGVRLTRDTDGTAVTRELKPLYSLDHHSGFATATKTRPVLFWTESRHQGYKATEAAGQCLLSFVTVGGEEAEPPRDEQIDAALLCTNGSAPASMPWGEREGDFSFPDRSVAAKITLLLRPTDSAERHVPRNQYWYVIQCLSAGPFSLDQKGLPSLKALLEGHVPSADQASIAQINAIVSLARETAMEWIVEKPQSRMARGLRVRLALNESALTAVPIVVLARVLESVFVQYAPAHSFVQLVLISANNGAELARGQLLPGVVPVI